jgi:S-adenosylmethionine decarboxylase
VRGFTRDTSGNKHWIDHKITSIQNFIDPKILAQYNAVDVNVYQENLFHTKAMYKELDLNRYLFGGADATASLTDIEREMIIERLKCEIEEIFYGRSLS